MRTSGGRTKRIRLLRREINSLRQKMSQQPQQTQSVNGNDNKNEDEGKYEEKEEAMDQGKKQKGENIEENKTLTEGLNSGKGSFRYFKLF